MNRYNNPQDADETFKCVICGLNQDTEEIAFTDINGNAICNRCDKATRTSLYGKLDSFLQSLTEEETAAMYYLDEYLDYIKEFIEQ